jgi:hypothetical protein
MIWLVSINYLSGAFDTPIIQIGSVWVVLSQDIKNSTSLIRGDYANRKDNANISNYSHAKLNQSVTYLVLSSRHIMLCDIDDKILKYTQPEPLSTARILLLKAPLLLLIALHAAHIKRTSIILQLSCKLLFSIAFRRGS